MITQKVPQSFKEAVDSIEEQLQAAGETASGGEVSLLLIEFSWLIRPSDIIKVHCL